MIIFIVNVNKWYKNTNKKLDTSWLSSKYCNSKDVTYALIIKKLL